MFILLRIKSTATSDLNEQYWNGLMRIPSKADCLHPFKVQTKILTPVSSAQCVLAIITFVPCVDVAVIGLLGSRIPAELCSRPLRQSFRTNLLRSQGHNWGPARHESAELHGLCGFITVGLKNTNQTAEKQALNSAIARQHVLYTVLRLVCLSINAYIDWSTHWVTDLTTQLWLKIWLYMWLKLWLYM